jgi:pre-mRNA-processing factor 40
MNQPIPQQQFQQTPYPMQQHQSQQIQALHAVPQHAIMGPMATAAATAPKTPTNPNDVVTNWSIHKGTNGVDFYHNSVTGESTFTRPSCLGPGPSTTADGGSTTSNGKKRSWSQHTDPATGRVFYYDGTVTTWEKPEGFQEDALTEESDEKDQPPAKKRKKKKEESPVMYNNKAEAVAAFKGLLLAKDILPTMKWNEVVKICSSDQRWEACSTLGERKQALAEYQTKRANELREEKRQEKVRAKDAFMKLLTDVLPTIRAFDASNNTAFHEIRDYLSKDDRFHAVEEEENREELYLDFVEEIRKQDERQKRTRKREAKTAFLAFLKAKEESGALTYASTWQTFVSSLVDSDTVDPRFVVSPHMSDQERQLYFADHVIELQVLEDEKRRRIRDARRRAEKAQRDAFRETLANMAKEGRILPTSRWRNIEDMLVSEETFKAVREQGRNEPQLIFDDYIDEWADIYQADKAFLSDLLSKSKDTAFRADSKYEDFTKVLLDAAAPSPDSYRDVRRIIQEELPVSSAKILFDEIIAVEKASKIRNRCSGRRITDDSSEDEGEIVEDGEVTDDLATVVANST